MPLEILKGFTVSTRELTQRMDALHVKAKDRDWAVKLLDGAADGKVDGHVDMDQDKIIKLSAPDYQRLMKTLKADPMLDAIKPHIDRLPTQQELARVAKEQSHPEWVAVAVRLDRAVRPYLTNTVGLKNVTMWISASEMVDRRTLHVASDDGERTFNIVGAKQDLVATVKDAFKPQTPQTKTEIARVPFEPNAAKQWLPAMKAAENTAKALGYSGLRYEGTGMIARSIEVVVNPIEVQKILLQTKDGKWVEIGQVLPEGRHLAELKGSAELKGEIEGLIRAFQDK